MLALGKRSYTPAGGSWSFIACRWAAAPFNSLVRAELAALPQGGQDRTETPTILVAIALSISR
jgi:hypothetical protein